MNRPQPVPLDRLLGTLPEYPELGVLRDALLAASELDPDHAWSSTSRYVTFDKRVVDVEAVTGALRSSRAAAHQRLDRLYAAVEAMLLAITTGDSADAAQHLLALGELAESEYAWPEAGASAERAASLAAEHRDAGTLARALRRLARVRLGQGELADAQRLYRQSAEQAAAIGDIESEITALLGAGNAFALQGCWGPARVHYEAALTRSDPGHVRLRAQVLINLAMIAHEERRYAEAADRLAEAETLQRSWSGADRSGWCNVAGQVQLARGAHESARLRFEEALRHATTAFDRAMVMDNLSEEALRRGALADAESWARRAEQQALAGAAPRALAEVYLRLGRIARIRGDGNGVTFFEKALELCRTHSFRSLEATTCCEYGAFRAALGEHEEARSWLERGRLLFDELGASAGATDAAAALLALAPPAP